MVATEPRNMDTQARPSWYSCSRDMIEELVSPSEGRLNSSACALAGPASVVMTQKPSALTSASVVTGLKSMITFGLSGLGCLPETLQGYTVTLAIKELVMAVDSNGLKIAQDVSRTLDARGASCIGDRCGLAARHAALC